MAEMYVAYSKCAVVLCAVELQIGQVFYFIFAEKSLFFF